MKGVDTSPLLPLKVAGDTPLLHSLFICFFFFFNIGGRGEHQTKAVPGHLNPLPHNTSVTPYQVMAHAHAPVLRFSPRNTFPFPFPVATPTPSPRAPPMPAMSADRFLILIRAAQAYESTLESLIKYIRAEQSLAVSAGKDPLEALSDIVARTIILPVDLLGPKTAILKEQLHWNNTRLGANRRQARYRDRKAAGAPMRATASRTPRSSSGGRPDQFVEQEWGPESVPDDEDGMGNVILPDNAPSRPERIAPLESYEIIMPGDKEREEVAERVRSGKITL